MSRRGRGRRDVRRAKGSTTDEVARGEHVRAASDREHARTGSDREHARPARARESDDDVEVSRALRLGRIMAVLFVAVAVLLLLLAALGRGTPYLIGALDFAVIGGALAWIGWRDPGGRPRR